MFHCEGSDSLVNVYTAIRLLMETTKISLNVT